MQCRTKNFTICKKGKDYPLMCKVASIYDRTILNEQKSNYMFKIHINL